MWEQGTSERWGAVGKWPTDEWWRLQQFTASDRNEVLLQFSAIQGLIYTFNICLWPDRCSHEHSRWWLSLAKLCLVPFTVVCKEICKWTFTCMRTLILDRRLTVDGAGRNHPRGSTNGARCRNMCVHLMLTLQRPVIHGCCWAWSQTSIPTSCWLLSQDHARRRSQALGVESGNGSFTSKVTDETDIPDFKSLSAWFERFQCHPSRLPW